MSSSFEMSILSPIPSPIPSQFLSARIEPIVGAPVEKVFTGSYASV